MDVTEDLGAAMTTIAPQDLEADPDLVVVTPNICKAAFPFFTCTQWRPRSETRLKILPTKER